MKLLLILLTTLTLTSPAFAYVPKLATMLAKIGANNGGTKGLVIKRTITLKEENISWDETWYVSHADAMKVIADGKNPDGSPWSFEVLYKGGKRTTPTVEGKAKTYPLSPEFFEPLLHYRSSRALSSKLSSMQVLPTWAAQAADAPADEKFMTLDRFKGGVVYVLGTNETKNPQLPPRLWIEQDSFVLKKLRLGSQVEVEFEASKDYDEGKIKQPEQQSIFWKSATVLIQNKSLDITEQSKIEPFLKLQKGEMAKLPTNVNIKEFYSRFR